MKKPHVLNRPMFNKGGASAYGRGIASNLVSDEQRQRFNYGGRVGYAGLPYPKRRYTDQFVAPLYDPLNIPDLSLERMGLASEKYDDIGRRTRGSGYGQKQEEAKEQLLEEELQGMDKSEQDVFYDTEREMARLGVSPDYTTTTYTDPEGKEYSGIGLIEREKRITQDDPPGGQEIMTDSDWMELLGPTEEQKKRTKGEAQLGLAAGALDVFSQPTIAKGMRAASPHLSKLAQTASADQKAREKAILQGKVLSKVYTDRATAKGAADIKTLEAKAKMLEESDTPQAFYEVAKVKESLKNAMSKALNYTIPTVKKDDKGIPIIPEGTTEDTVMWDDAFMVLKDGNLVPITVDGIFALTKN